jgi:hypothetical protein
MIRLLLVILVPGALILAAAYYIAKGMRAALRAWNKVEFVYVRFRDGILVLKKTSRFGEEEIQYKTGQAWNDLGPKQLAAHTTGINWFHFPGGQPVEVATEEEVAIQRCLRFADNTGLLAAEQATE